MNTPTTLFIWFAKNEGRQQRGEHYIRAWTGDAAQVPTLQEQHGEPLVYRAISDAAGAPTTPVELLGVEDELKNGDGFWRTCSGCHETEDGHPVGHYPFSAILNCDLGAGCSECGGIGAVWDNTDYGAMADAWDAQEVAREQAEEAQKQIMRFDIIGNLINPDPNGMYVRYEDHARLAAPVAPAAPTSVDFDLAVKHEIARAMESGSVNKVINAVLAARHVAADAAAPSEAEFKNFHRLLCDRFGYVHDERDWKRDQLSLIECIANWRDQFEFLDVQNHTARRAMRKIMARLTELLDEDRFAEIEEIVRNAGVEPPPVSAQADEHVAYIEGDRCTARTAMERSHRGVQLPGRHETLCPRLSTTSSVIG